MKTIKLLTLSALVITFTACTNDAEKHRESEVNTDTIDTTAQDRSGMSDTTHIDSSTNTLPPSR